MVALFSFGNLASLSSSSWARPRAGAELHQMLEMVLHVVAEADRGADRGERHRPLGEGQQDGMVVRDVAQLLPKQEVRLVVERGVLIEQGRDDVHLDRTGVGEG